MPQKPRGAITKISLLVVIVVLLMIPMVYPERLNWSNNNVGLPISLLHSGTKWDISTNDWPDAMRWVKENTPKDAVIASWWDYGYWISTLSERKTLADNATLLDFQIRKIAATYLSTPDDAWKILTSDAKTDVSSHYVTLPADMNKPARVADCQTGEYSNFSVSCYGKDQEKLDTFKNWRDCVVEETSCSLWSSEKIYDAAIAAQYPTLFDYWESEVYVYPPILTGLDADYILINLAVDRLSEENITTMYTLEQRGGDETKVFWFLKIADVPVMDYYNPELLSYTDKFWNETLLGKLIPFTPLVYVDPNNTEIQSETFKPGYTAIYLRDIKFPSDSDGPFQLVYVSPGFEGTKGGPIGGVIIYKINKEYSW